MSKEAELFLNDVAEWQWARLKQLPEADALRRFCLLEASILIARGI